MRFQNPKNAYRETKFQSGEELKTRAVQMLRDLPEDKFLKEIKSLYEHCYRVLACNGECVI